MEFMEELKAISEEAREIKEFKKFNIFSALHKEHDERCLHSRFIAYLLSPEAPHGEEDKFLRLFFEKALVLNPEEYGECDIMPTPEKKSEHKKSDIYIKAKTKVKAIIIENKIYAPDSNTPDGTPQMVNYFKKIQEELKLNDDEEAKKNIKLVYLTLNERDPSLLNKFDGYNLCKIDYRTEIQDWLEACADVTKEPFLKKCIEQYRDLVIKITNNVKRAQYLHKLIGKKIEKNLLTDTDFKYIQTMIDFPHVKWHTIADFWNELSETLEKQGFCVVKKMSVDEITKVAHREKKSSFSIIFHKLHTPDNKWYIANDVANGLTFGNTSERPKCEEGKDWFPICKEIKFAEFDNNTFNLIDKSHRERVIERIIKEINKKVVA